MHDAVATATAAVIHISIELRFIVTCKKRRKTITKQREKIASLSRSKAKDEKEANRSKMALDTSGKNDDT